MADSGGFGTSDGGDPACWAGLVCQECGAVISEGHLATCSFGRAPAALETGWLSQEIVTYAPDAIIMADREGIIRLWNGGASTVFGFTAEEAIGHSLDLIIPERFRARHWEGFGKVMETGVTRYGAELLAVPAIRKDGAPISVEFSVTLLQDLAGRVLGVAAIMRDVTERWTEQKQLRQRLAELEAALAARSAG
jgi:PAS domain S-box-containing protein